MTKDELIEKLTREDHESWRLWMTLFLASGKKQPDGSLAISSEYAEKLYDSSQTIYDEMSEKEKESYRDRVARILPIIGEYTGAIVASSVSHTVEVMLKRDVKSYSSMQWIELKEKLMPVLEKIYVFAQIPDKLEERKLWADVYKDLCSLVQNDNAQSSLQGE